MKMERKMQVVELMEKVGVGKEKGKGREVGERIRLQLKEEICKL